MLKRVTRAVMQIKKMLDAPENAIVRRIDCNISHIAAHRSKWYRIRTVPRAHWHNIFVHVTGASAADS
jgi:hypothetical protein